MRATEGKGAFYRTRLVCSCILLDRDRIVRDRAWETLAVQPMFSGEPPGYDQRPYLTSQAFKEIR
jgi:hypothetical protein